MIAHYGEADGVKISRKHLGWYRKQWSIASPAEGDAAEEYRFFSNCLKSTAAHDHITAVQRWLRVALAL
jgi:tRNA-dihydrouridine synthase